MWLKLAVFYFVLGNVIYFVNGDDTTEDLLCGSHCRYSNTYCDAHGQRCLYGCQVGWIGEDCSATCTIHRCEECYLDNSSEICVTCRQGYYGDRCQHVCSNNCILGKCDRDGNCLYGCKTGWIDTKCEKKDCPFDHCMHCDVSYSDALYCLQCETGWYSTGFTCEQCSSMCAGGPSKCNGTTGVCWSGCADSWFGPQCLHECTITNCRKCIKTGYSQTLSCSECVPGWYLDENRQSCIECNSKCFGNTHCDTVTGDCLGNCTAGYFGAKCDKECTFDHCELCGETSSSEEFCSQCMSGWYWSTSDLSCIRCSTHCLGVDSHCNPQTGWCLDGCEDGYYGHLCQYVCSDFCESTKCDVSGTCLQGCETGYYGNRCDRNCPDHCYQCEHFENGVCTECEAGWYGPQCELRCGEYCRPSQQNNYVYCSKTTGECINGCNGGMWGQLCDRTCSQNCIAQACAQSTGICQGCTPWWYGDKCENQCSTNCFQISELRRACDIQTGECTAGCISGWFGNLCSLQCSSMCKESSCAQFSGLCGVGCLAGYHGKNCTESCSSTCHTPVCDKETAKCEGCISGHYGDTCKKMCWDRCKNNVCSQDSGHCTDGCQDGFYGEECSSACPRSCKQSCQQYTGNCDSGCLPGWHGVTCADACQPGQYGENCSELCGSCQGDNPCDRFDGSCFSGCDIGWMGGKCLQKVQADIHPAAGEAESSLIDNNSVVIGGSTSAVVLLVVILSFIFYFMCKRKKMKKQQKTESVNGDFQLQDMSASPTLAHHAFVKMGSQPLAKENLRIEDHVIMSGHFSELQRGKLIDGRNEHIVAVKCCHEMTPDRYVKREIGILKYIGHHQNIIGLIGVCEDDDCVFIVMEYCEEGDILTYLRWSQNRFFNMVALQFNIAEAMAFLEQKKIILRNLNASNVYLEKNLNPKIVNFEWAVSEDSEDLILRGDRQSNKLPSHLFPWMALECLKLCSYSGKSDVWSFGVFLWELETMGADPFSEMDNSEIASHLSRGYRLSVPSRCVDFISRMMQNCWLEDPVDRPSFSQLSSMFTHFLENRQALQVHLSVPDEISTTV